VSAPILLRRALGEDALQRAPVHVEAARGFRDVPIAQFVNALDMLPADAVGRHWIFRRLDLSAVEREQGRGNIIGVDRLGEIVNGAELYRVHRGSDVALARENDGARFRTPLLHRRNNVETVSVA
jgi:hypothetical protein